MSEWKWVPVEPTEAMERNAWTDDGCRKEPQSCKRIYKAMLAAAPTPEVEPGVDPIYQLSWDDVNWVDISKANFDSRAIDKGLAQTRKLYTHPAPSDELVKAAEAAWGTMVSIKQYFIESGFKSGEDEVPEELSEDIDRLRAELDKVKP